MLNTFRCIYGKYRSSGTTRIRFLRIYTRGFAYLKTFSAIIVFTKLEYRNYLCILVSDTVSSDQIIANATWSLIYIVP